MPGLPGCGAEGKTFLGVLDGICPCAPATLPGMKINSTDLANIQAALGELGLAPFSPDDFPAAQLFQWMTQPRTPLLASIEPLLRQLIAAVMRRDRTAFVYMGGTVPGRVRMVSPNLVFQLYGTGPVYVSGYCHERKEARVFRFDRMLAATVWN